MTLLLMVGTGMIEENLRRARVTADDLRANLREANMLTTTRCDYVVFETTGDVRVIHGDGDSEPDIRSDVVDSERVFEPR